MDVAIQRTKKDEPGREEALNSILLPSNPFFSVTLYRYAKVLLRREYEDLVSFDAEEGGSTKEGGREQADLVLLLNDGSLIASPVLRCVPVSPYELV